MPYCKLHKHMLANAGYNCNKHFQCNVEGCRNCQKAQKQGAACKQRQGMIACNNNNMCNHLLVFTDAGIWVYTCYYCCIYYHTPRSSPAFACMLYLLQTDGFWHFNILLKMFLLLLHWFFLCVATRV